MSDCIYTTKICPYCSCHFEAAYEVDIHLFEKHREHFLKNIPDTELVGSGDSANEDVEISVKKGEFIDNFLSEYKIPLEVFNF